MRNSIFKALAHPDRRKILTLLRSGPQLAGELASEFKSSWPTMSRHMAILKEADLISKERKGTQILYRVNTSVVEDTAHTLLTLIGHQPEGNALGDSDTDSDTDTDTDKDTDDIPLNYKEAAE